MVCGPVPVHQSPETGTPVGSKYHNLFYSSRAHRALDSTMDLTIRTIFLCPRSRRCNLLPCLKSSARNMPKYKSEDPPLSLRAYLIRFQVNLKSGTNILYWRTTGILVGGKMVKPVLLKNIQIEGKLNQTTTALSEHYNTLQVKCSPPSRGCLHF